jgi:hypothetical protein
VVAEEAADGACLNPHRSERAKPPDGLWALERLGTPRLRSGSCVYAPGSLPHAL